MHAMASPCCVECSIGKGCITDMGKQPGLLFRAVCKADEDWECASASSSGGGPFIDAINGFLGLFCRAQTDEGPSTKPGVGGRR
jgi:hypothetical protein